MERYRIEGKLGSGAFGSVYKATHRDTGVRCAIKKMRQRYDNWEECLALREVQALCTLRHPALVQLFAVIREKQRLYLVFEFVGPNLYQAIKDRTQPLPEPKIRSYLRQALQGLAHMHKAGYVHRDVKPENLLLRGPTLKIADLGLARPLAGPEWDEDGRPWTEYVSTRWYRAPEILLRSRTYGPAVDIYALGAVAAELYSLRPLFPGGSEMDQLACISGILGSPTKESWGEGVRLASELGFAFQDVPPQRLGDVLPEASTEAISLIAAMCVWDPEKRLTAEQLLEHPYFAKGAGERRPLATPCAAAVTAQLLEAAERVGDEGWGSKIEQEAAALKRLAQRTAKRQRAVFRRQRTRNSQAKHH